MRASVVVLTIAVTIAGCLQDSGGSDGGADSIFTDFLDETYTLVDCQVAIVGHFVDAERAQSALPPEVIVRDPGHLLGYGDSVPDGTGRATLIHWLWECEDGPWGSMSGAVSGIDVHRPIGATLSPEGREHAMYEVWRATSSKEHAAQLALAQIPVVHAEVSIEPLVIAGVPIAQATVSTDDVIFISASGGGPTPFEGGLSADHWRIGPNGISLIEFDGASVNRFMQPIECTVASSTPMARIYDGTECSGEPFIFNWPALGDVAFRERFEPIAAV